MPTAGENRKVAVPDTLDLVERAGFGINALAGTILPQFNHDGERPQKQEA